MFKVSLGIYKRDILFFFNQADFLAFAEKEEVYEEELFEMSELSDGKTVLTERWFIMCYISDEENHWLIAHEIFHCVEFIFRQVWIELNSGSDEAYAYALQYVTEELYELIKSSKDD